jgi:hypothetical protein
MRLRTRLIIVSTSQPSEKASACFPCRARERRPACERSNVRLVPQIILAARARTLEPCDSHLTLARLRMMDCGIASSIAAAALLSRSRRQKCTPGQKPVSRFAEQVRQYILSAAAGTKTRSCGFLPVASAVRRRHFPKQNNNRTKHLAAGPPRAALQFSARRR